MTVNSLADLKKLIQLCQKQGVSRIEVDGVKLELGDVPVRSLNRNDANTDKIEVEHQYSDEDTLLWSATPHG